jgi:hypothetical protein
MVMQLAMPDMPKHACTQSPQHSSVQPQLHAITHLLRHTLVSPWCHVAGFWRQQGLHAHCHRSWGQCSHRWVAGECTASDNSILQLLVTCRHAKTANGYPSLGNAQQATTAHCSCWSHAGMPKNAHGFPSLGNAQQATTAYCSCWHM